jgi:hypothetical protein
MTQTSLLVALGLCLAAAVATMGIGAILLRNSVREASDLASMLPTRPIKEDTTEGRETNRRKAILETLLLLAFRSAPGVLLVVCGAGVLVWVCSRFLPMFRI